MKGIRSAVQLVGCIWWNGHFFRRFAGYMNETKYMDFLQAGLAARAAGWRRKSLLHDQASYHTTESVENWFADRGINLITNAPKAPKWNAIEYVWKWIKEYVKQKAPSTLRQLERAIDDACKDFPANVRRACIEKAQSELRAEAAAQ